MKAGGTALLRSLDLLGVQVPLNSDALGARTVALQELTALPCLAPPALARGTEPTQPEPRPSCAVWSGSAPQGLS